MMVKLSTLGVEVPQEILKVPAVVDDAVGRVETGPVQFGDDWPGVFIRGDNAMSYAGCLEHVLLTSDGPMPIFEKRMIEGLVKVLKSCRV